MTTVVNAGTVRNRFDAYNIKCAELRNAMNENLDEAKKCKESYLTLKSKDTKIFSEQNAKALREMTISERADAISYWEKSEEYRLKLEAFENKFNPEKNNKVKYNLKTCKFYISK